MLVCGTDRESDVLRPKERATVLHPDRSSQNLADCVTVCHPVWQLARGGLERQLLTAVAHLPRDRFRHILAICNKSDAADQIDAELPESAVVWRMTRAGQSPNLSEQLATLMTKHGVDVLHVRGFSMLMDALRAADLIGGVPVAMSFHGFETYPPQFSPLRRDLYRAALERCDQRWAVSRQAAISCGEYFGIASDRFDVVTNGVDTDRFKPAADRAAAKEARGLSLDRPVVLCVGNLKPIKGHSILMEAARLLSAEGSAFTLVLVGRDYSGGRLPQIAASIPGPAQIVFAGSTDDVCPWLHAADLYVQPSRWEGLSNSLLEAMSCGLPVVATAVGGTVDVIEHESSGLLVPPDNAMALAAGLKRLLSDEHLRQALGQAARERICHGCRQDAMLAALADQYSLLAEWKRKRS